MQGNTFFTEDDEFFLMQGSQITESEAKTYSNLRVIRMLGLLAEVEDNAESLRGVMREIADKEVRSLYWKYTYILVRAQELGL